jgi:two-component system, chemotaxis family, chemotaxis protein CheY
MADEVDQADKAIPEDWSFLIVDDNPTALATLRTLMMVLGLEPPLEAAGGAEAQDLVRRHEFDCIITDLRMEPMNGVEFVHWLTHSNEAGNPIARILAISAYRDPAEIAAVAAEGADGFFWPSRCLLPACVQR